MSGTNGIEEPDGDDKVQERQKEHAAEVKNYTDQRLMGKESASIGSGAMAGGVAMAAIEALRAQQAEKLKEDEKHIELILLIQERMKMLEEKIAEYDKVIDKFEGLIDDVEVGKTVTDESGELLDKELEAKVKAYEKEHGVKVDRNNAESLQTVLDDIKTDRDDAQRQYDELEELSDQPKEVQIKKAQELGLQGEVGKKKLDDLLSKTDNAEVQEEVIERLDLSDEGSERLAQTVEDESAGLVADDGSDLDSLLGGVEGRPTSVAKALDGQEEVASIKQPFNESSGVSEPQQPEMVAGISTPSTTPVGPQVV